MHVSIICLPIYLDAYAAYIHIYIYMYLFIYLFIPLLICMHVILSTHTVEFFFTPFSGLSGPWPRSRRRTSAPLRSRRRSSRSPPPGGQPTAAWAQTRRGDVSHGQKHVKGIRWGVHGISIQKTIDSRTRTDMAVFINWGAPFSGCPENDSPTIWGLDGPPLIFGNSHVSCVLS